MGKHVLFKSWGGQVVGGEVHRSFLFFRQIEYTSGTRWAYPEPYVYTQKIKWFPVWRILS